MTFAKAAEDYIGHGATWSRKHLVQWRQTLARLVLPVIGEMDVAAVDTGDVLRVLTPIWTKTPVTASRVARRGHPVLASATARGLETRVRIRQHGAHLDKLLPAPTKIARVEHFAAMDYHDIGAFMAELRSLDGVAARALEFTILTGVRSAEGLGARWSEIDLDERVWTIPLAGNIEFRCPTRRSRSSSRWR